MRLSDRIELYRAQPTTSSTRREVAVEVQRQRRLVRKQRAAAALAGAREKLTPEDQALAANYRTPEGTEERRAAAHALLMVGDRRRTYREIAAIMGISQSAVKNYFWDRDGSKSRARYDSSPNPERRGRTPTRLERMAELTPPDEPVGVRIHRRRRTRKLSQVKLAEQLGVPRERIRAWESGEAKPTPAEYAQVATLLGL